jgi:hypothetical protein
MENNISWVAILGAVTGVLGSLGWVSNYIIGFLSKPKLVFSKGPYVMTWNDVNSGAARRFVNFEVGVSNKKTAKRCVATAKIIKYPNGVNLQDEYALHWADVPYSSLSTSMEPVDIGGESRRLDVVFTAPGLNGARIAMPIALSRPESIMQAILPPGTYVIKVSVYCENGRGVHRIIRIIPTEQWHDLKAENVKKQTT